MHGANRNVADGAMRVGVTVDEDGGVNRPT